MNKKEFTKIKNLTYKEYCGYLQNKYGVSQYNYMTSSFNQIPKCKKTDEGLVIHHIFENKVINLSKKELAQKHPFDYQEKENLVYCDLLEHLWCHILICQEFDINKDVKNNEFPGIGGVINFLVPELNDVFYSEWKTSEKYQQNLHNKIINDKNVYEEMLKICAKTLKKYPFYKKEWLLRSWNVFSPYGAAKSWTKENEKNYLKFKNSAKLN